LAAQVHGSPLIVYFHLASQLPYQPVAGKVGKFSLSKLKTCFDTGFQLFGKLDTILARQAENPEK